MAYGLEVDAGTAMKAKAIAVTLSSISLVYLTTRAPSELASDLTLAGYTVWEALAVSEVLYICEQHNIDVVVIAPDVEDVAVVEVQMRRMTLTLKPGATAKDVVWELAQLFPSASRPSVQ